MSRYNILHTPHKVWRRIMSDLCAQVKSIDYEDTQQVQATTQFAYSVLAVWKAHSHSENTVFAPALKQPYMGQHWADVHEMHGMGVKLIKDDLVQLEKTTPTSKRIQLGKQLSSHLEHFVAEDNMHTMLEESHIFPMLSGMYNDQELFDLDVKATSVWTTMKENEKELIFPYFIRAHKGEDHPRILRIFKQILGTKPEAWQKFVEMAKKELTPAQITKFRN
eukprot:Phypoly_transcript_15468.p1 GENE.Phypoly_transcript_15468~~Phypoly_transcript_15468.p1  ORF type:complete len:221 (+),score=29.93 Phypoly_transcript_15468:94-756(+)